MIVLPPGVKITFYHHHNVENIYILKYIIMLSILLYIYVTSCCLDLYNVQMTFYDHHDV